MKYNIILFITAIVLTFIYTGCEQEDTITPTPIPPILKEISFPSESSIMPGKITTITGKGFSGKDKLSLIGDQTYVVEITSVNDFDISFIVPKEAGGQYTVIVERDGQTTTLEEKLKIPLIVVLEDVVLPSAVITQETLVEIVGKGFEQGDKIKLSASFYPEGYEFEISTNITNNGITFTLPQGAFGVNSLVVTRGNKMTNLGTIIIETNVGDELGGGVVFWVDNSKSHGLICNKSHITESAVNYGPALPEVGTLADIGSGKENSEKLKKQISDWRQSGDGEWLTKKTVVELCDEHTVTVNEVVYNDWFLPSEGELSELFLAKNIVAEKGAIFKSDNYWTSTEVVGNGWAWAQLYVNFYEPENLVTGVADRVNWLIGVIPIREF